MEKYEIARIEELINSKFQINEEQHKNILAKVDLSISVHKEILKQHEEFLKSIREEIVVLQNSDKTQTIDIAKAKGLASGLGVLATLATIVATLALFIH